VRSRAVGMPSLRRLLLPGLGIIRTGKGANCRALRSSRSLGKNSSSAERMASGRMPSTPADRFPLLPPHPCPRNYEDSRVVDKVEQVIEATIRINARPLVQLGLDSQYLHLGPFGLRPQHIGIHRRSPAIPVPTLRTRCRPSPCDRLSRPRTTTTAPPRPGPTSRRRTCPHPTWMAGSRDQPETLPTFTTYRSTGSVPSFAPAASPRVRRSSSSWPPCRRLQTAQESPAHPKGGGRACTALRPTSTRLEPVYLLRGFTRWFLTYTFPS